MPQACFPFLFTWISGEAHSRFSQGCEGRAALRRDVSYKMSFTISLSQTSLRLKWD